jgi:hypothetical protein
VSALLSEARAAREAALAAAEESRQAWRREQSQAALAELRSVLVRPDGTQLNLSDLGLSRVESDMEAGLAVWSDGTVSLGCQRREEWRCVLVVKVDGAWTSASGRLRSLADLGAALEAR